MLKSMTGFGKAVQEFDDKVITVEIRSLNSKNMDLSLRMSSMYRDKELELRNEIGRLLERGKIDLSVYVEGKSVETPVEINIELAKAYYAKLRQLATELGEKDDDLLKHVVKMPEVMKAERKEPNEGEWKQIHSVLLKAMAGMNEFRETEGRSLDKDFKERLGIIVTCLNKVKEMDQRRVAAIKDRIRNNILEIVNKDTIDNNRFEQEMIYYVEKLDINEEKVRLQTHCDYFLNTMKEPSCGRKLNFIAQEIGREINTIGSKANDAEIQKLVVLMKDELEKIKEQTNNVL